MKIKFAQKEMEFGAPLSVFDAAREAELVSRAHLAAKVNGKLVDMTYPLTEDAEVEMLTFEDADGRHVFNHTAAHVLAQAVKRLYPAAKLTIGPAIENGFYYDFDMEHRLVAEDLKEIEKVMKKIIC